jgi:outer membrane protein assembly factor BamB
MRTFKLILVFLLFTCGMWCVRKKAPYEPEPRWGVEVDSTGTPEIIYGDTAHSVRMPQQEILWPSLADSPWPMHKRTPQCVARTPYPGPVNGIILWETTIPGGKLMDPPVIDASDRIYLTNEYANVGPSRVFCVNPNGEIQWTFPDPQISEHFAGSPLIGSDGTVYVNNWLKDGLFYAIHPDGSVKWTCPLDGLGSSCGNNIGLDGTLFTVTWEEGILYAIHPDGTVKWESTGSGGGYESSSASVVLSPDGETLYVEDKSERIVAVHTADGSEKWSFDSGLHWHTGLMVDNQGRIYFETSTHIVCVDENGTEEWRYESSDIYLSYGGAYDCCMAWD